MLTESLLRIQPATRFSVTWAGEGQAFLVASVRSPADAARSAGDSYARIAETLREHCLEIVHERIFGGLSVEPFVTAARRSALETYDFAPDNPCSYIQGNPSWGDGFAGAIIHAVAPNRAEDVWTIRDNDVPCGRGWRRNASTYLMLQNIQGQAESRSGQVRRMFERADRILRDNHASYKNVARTWLYLSEISEWYPVFNKARSEKYGEFGIMPGPGDTTLQLPASTGIGADTPSGAAASMDLVAVVGNGDIPSPVMKLSSRKQLDAYRYGAAFSRGAVIKEDDATFIHVSGTAAINEHGVSLHPDDIRSQIKCTFDKIDSLLGQEGACLADICAATVFVKRSEYAKVFWRMAADRGLVDFPAVCVIADVCREELLFELDGEAVVAGKGCRGEFQQNNYGR